MRIPLLTLLHIKKINKRDILSNSILVIKKKNNIRLFTLFAVRPGVFFENEETKADNFNTIQALNIKNADEANRINISEDWYVENRKEKNFINDLKTVNRFWSELLRRNIYIEEGVGKKPRRGQKDRFPLTSTESILAYLGTGQENTVRISYPENVQKKFTILDFDLHKVEDSHLEKVYFKKILTLAQQLDLTVVQSPRGGLHLYFEHNPACDFQKKNTVDRILRTFIPYVDILINGVTGPSADRIILRIASYWGRELEVNLSSYMIPRWLLPIWNTPKGDHSIVKNRMPKEDLGKCIKKGCRRRSLITLLKLHPELTDEDIQNINNNIFIPPKEPSELNAEVLNNRPEPDKKYNSAFNLEDYDFSNFCFDNDDGLFYFFDSCKNRWESIETDILLSRVQSEWKLSPGVLTKNKQAILDHVRWHCRSSDIFEDFKGFPLFFKNNPYVINLEKGDKMKVEKLESKDLLKRLFIKSDFPFVEPYLEIQKKVSTLNEIEMREYSEIEILKLIKKFSPNVFKFIFSKFNYESQQVKEEQTLAIYRLIFLLFLKNFEQYEFIRIQRIFIFHGRGGSGKSALLDLIKNFVYESAVFLGDLSTSNNRFETGFMRGKTWVLFPDEDSVSNFSKKDNVPSFLKKLSGEETLRFEAKFGSVGSFKNKALIGLSSNSDIFNYNGDYSAMKRRIQNFFINQTLKAEVADDNIVQKVLNKDFVNICLIALKISPFIKELKKVIYSYNTELVILQNNEFKAFEKETDLFVSFLFNFIAPMNNRDVLNETWITWDHLFCIFVQYIVFRKGSTVEIEDLDSFIDETKELLLCFDTRAVIGSENSARIHKMLEKSLGAEEIADPVFSTMVHKFKHKLIERRPFLGKDLQFIEERRVITWDKYELKKPENETDGVKLIRHIRKSLKTVVVGIAFEPNFAHALSIPENVIFPDIFSTEPINSSMVLVKAQGKPLVYCRESLGIDETKILSRDWYYRPFRNSDKQLSSSVEEKSRRVS